VSRNALNHQMATGWLLFRGRGRLARAGRALRGWV